MPYRILIIEGDEDDYFLTLDCIESINDFDHHVDWISDGLDIMNGQVDCAGYDIILCSYRVGAVTGVEIVRRLTVQANGVPCVLLCGVMNEDVARAAKQAGAILELAKDAMTPDVMTATFQYARANANHRSQSRLVSDERLRRNG